MSGVSKLKDVIPGYNSLVLPKHWVSAVKAGVKHRFPAKRLRVIGVTGTNGKTTTCFMIWKMLNTAGRKAGLMTTVAWGVEELHAQVEHMTTVDAETLNQRMEQIVAEGAEFLVLEVTSHAMVQYRTLGVPVEIAVMTNVTHEHLDYHRTFERYREAKQRLFRKARYGVVNADDESAEYFMRDVGRDLRGATAETYEARGGGMVEEGASGDDRRAGEQARGGNIDKVGFQGKYITYGINNGKMRAFDVKLGADGVEYACGDIKFEDKDDVENADGDEKREDGALLHNSKNTVKLESTRILATGVKNELCNKYHDNGVSTAKISPGYTYSKSHGVNTSTKNISLEYLYSKTHGKNASTEDISSEYLYSKSKAEGGAKKSDKCVKNGQKDEFFTVKTRIPGKFNVYNSLAAVCVGRKLGLTDEEICDGIYALTEVEGRMNRVDEGQNFEVIVDFAHTPDAFLKVYESVEGYVGRIITVTGGAGRRDESTRAERGEIAGKYSDILIITEDDSRDEDPERIAQMFVGGAERAGKRMGKDLFVNLDRESGIRQALGEAGEGDLVLVLGKGHEKTIIRKGGVEEFEDLKVVKSLLRAGN